MRFACITFNFYNLFNFFRERSRAGHELYRKAGHLTWESDLPMITSDLSETGLEEGELSD